MTTFSSEDVEGYRREIDGAWEAAVERGPVTDVDISIAGQDLRLRVVGEQLARVMLPALEHHRPAAGAPDALVGAWDATVGGGPLPLRQTDELVGIERWIVRNGDEVVAQIEGQSEYAVIRSADHRARRYLLGTEGVEGLPWWEGGAPFRRQLHWALAPHALPIHAAAVGSADGAALIVGRGGSGKSSTAVACLNAGMGFIGDDYCVLELDPEPIAHTLYCTSKVTPDEMPHVGALAGTRDPEIPGGPKPVIFPLRQHPERTLLQAPIRMLLLPIIGDGASTPTLERLTRGEALRALAPSSVMQLNLDPARELGWMRRLVGAVPAYRLLLSPERAANPELIAATLAEVGSELQGPTS